MHRFNSWYRGFCQRIIANSWLFVALWLLQFVISMQLFLMWFDLKVWMVARNLIGVTFWAVFFLIFVSLLPQRIGKTVSWIILGLVILIVSFEQYIISSYQTCFTTTIAMVILGTNPHEASEFLDTINFRPWVILSALLFIIVIASLGWKRLAHKIKVDNRRKVIILSILLLIPCIGYLFNIRTYRIWLMTTFPSYVQLAPIDRLWQTFYLTWDAVAQIDKLHKEFASMDIGKIQKTKDWEPHTVVLIIGESLRRNSMHCYGGIYPTTPHLDDLVAQGDLILFSDVVSSKPNTDASLCELLTFHTTDQSRPWYEYPTIVQIMSAAGYYTYWLSNQEKVVRFGQAMLIVPPLADSSLFVNTRLPDDDMMNSREESFDERVLPHLMGRKEQGQKKDKLFEIIHLNGQHSVFSKRYPKSYAKFAPQDMTIPVGESSEQKKATKAEYLNSVLYNDWIVSTIMRSYDDIPALVFYVSDHGINLFDNPSNPESAAHDVSKQALPIPLMVYVSPAMQKLHPELYEQVKAAKDRPVMSDVLTHSITGLLGIECRESKDKYNVFSPRYWGERPRVINAFERTVEFPYPIAKDPEIIEAR